MNGTRASVPSHNPQPRAEGIEQPPQDAVAASESGHRHLQRLTELLQRRQVGEALEVIRQSSDRFIRDSSVIGWHARFLLEGGATAEALPLVRAHLAATEESPEAIAVAMEYCQRANDPKRFADRLIDWIPGAESRPPTACQLVQCLLAIDRFAAAEGLATAALQHCPRDPRLLLSRALVNFAMGLADEADRVLDELQALGPLSPEAAMASTSFIHYRPRYSDRTALPALRQWRGGPTPVAQPARPRPPRAGKINIGFVSPDLNAHPVAYFLQAWLPHRNRERFSYHAYYSGSKEDSFTGRLRGNFDYWRNIHLALDPEVCRLVEKDRIDVLVDLCGYYKDQRMGIFARRPAPVQVNWLGWPGTSGLETMDYRIVDDITDPPGSDAWHTEKLIRLPDGFLCYPRDTASPPVGLPPILQNGYVTFGSTNSLLKLNDHVLALWGRLLAACPRARLVIRRSEFGDPHVRRLHWERCLRQGLPSDRTELMNVNHSPLLANIHQFYNLIDVALDPHPYTGTTTTFDSLWMGVPVVTLAGDSHQSRVSASILTRIGRRRWVAATEDEYLRIAAALAEDASELIEQRDTLRAALEASPWCDGPGFARRMEACFQGMLPA